MITLGIGDVVNLTSITSYTPTLQATFKPPKGKVFVAVLIGVADKKDPDNFDVEKALNELGLYQKAVDEVAKLETKTD
jgi:hypothetical protein